MHSKDRDLLLDSILPHVTQYACAGFPYHQWHAAGETFIRYRSVTKVRTQLKLYPGFDRLSKVTA